MIDVIIALVVLGVCLYVIDLIPIDATIKRIIHVVAILFAALWILQLLGFWHGFPTRVR